MYPVLINIGPITVQTVRRNTSINISLAGYENFHEKNLRLDILKMFVINNSK